MSEQQKHALDLLAILAAIGLLIPATRPAAALWLGATFIIERTPGALAALEGR